MNQPVYGAEVAFRMMLNCLYGLQQHADQDTFLPNVEPIVRQRFRAEIAEMIARCRQPQHTVADCQMAERFFMRLLTLHWRRELFADPSVDWMSAMGDVLHMTADACTAVAGANDSSFSQ